ncbi:MAG: phosphatase PAP2 family protein [Bacteroidales bacterium]|nr:phosphatase PAP2 family protein [Bacteroidales bacterium]
MGCLTVIDYLNGLDQEITLFINNLSIPVTDRFWMFMSDKTVWIPAYVLCAYFLFRRLGWKKALIVIASAGIAFALCDQLSNIVKHSVDRLRPSYDHRMLTEGLTVLEHRGGFFGFLSAHAANAFVFAVCLIIGFRNDKRRTYKTFTLSALTWAALVAASRIFVGKHYFGDVLVGTLVGLGIGYCCGMLARHAIRRFVDRAPSTAPSGSSPSGHHGNPSQGR